MQPDDRTAAGRFTLFFPAGFPASGHVFLEQFQYVRVLVGYEVRSTFVIFI